MRPALAFLCTLTLLAAVVDSSCCCPKSHGPACPDWNLPRDDSLKPTLGGQAIFVKRPVHTIDRSFCQMGLWGSYPLASEQNDRYEVVEIEFYGMTGEHTAEQVVAPQCPALLTVPWPEKQWCVPRLEALWDGGLSYTVAARVVYIHTLPDLSKKRVYTLVRGVFKNVVAAKREVGQKYAGTPTDQDTISTLTVGGVFQSSNHIALYDVSVDYTSASPTALIEVFSTDLNTPNNIWLPESRIWVDSRPPQNGHWAETQISGPFNPPASCMVGVRITYDNATQDIGRVFFLNPIGPAQPIPMQ